MNAHGVGAESTLPRAAVRIPRVLSIAGTDPTGGAGIQADLKSIAANGGYGMAVTTALVAQNTQGVRSIHVPPVGFLTEQLTAVSDDVTVDAVKLGMLFDTPIIDAVADWLRTNRPPVVVLDPVMVATSGDRLLTEDAEQAVRDLLQHADLVTPNIPELAVLVGESPASNWPEVLRQAAKLSADHCVLVLAKGGHLDGVAAPDALADGGDIFAEFSTRRVATRNTHGTGCSLSSAVATLQARSQNWEEAIRQAKAWLTESLAAADQLKVGRGHGPVSHFAGLWERAGLIAPTPEQIARDWWAGISSIREEIDGLAFVRRLGDGTLPEAAFVWYLGQDALYLRDYARALAEASRLAPTAHEQAFWASCAHGAIATEIELHGQWLPSDGLFAAEAGDVTTGYLNHLLAAAAKGGYDELVAALLPCFWIYVDVGSRLITHAVAENPYAAWLRTYAAPEFQEANREAVAIVTSRAATADETVRKRMRRAFEVSARYELDFFAAPLR